jgi:hypothetical protein
MRSSVEPEPAPAAGMSRFCRVIVRPVTVGAVNTAAVSQNTFSAPLTDFRPNDPVRPEASSRSPGRFFSRLPVVT